MALEVIPLSPVLGAEICGADLSKPQRPEAIDAMKAAWAEHLVVRFRGQTLTDDQLVAFSRHFGELDLAPPNEAANTKSGGYVPTHPQVTVISNVIVDGVPIGSLGAGEALWHTDMSYNPLPPSASALYAIEVPPSGGNTSFLNMYLAYETLPSDLRAVVETHQAVHDSSYTSAGGLRKGAEEVTDVSKAPGARHPMVRTHPVTGRPALYLGRRRNSYIVGLPVAESEHLLDAIWAHVMQDRFVWTQEWRTGDLVLWDNRCVMHRRAAFDADARRIMHRTQMKGDRPYFQQQSRHQRPGFAA